MRRVALAAGVAVCALAIAPAAPGASGVRVIPQTASIAYLDGRRIVTAAPQSPTYVLGDGSRHRITFLRSQGRRGAATEYRYATDEAKRTAVLTITRAHGGVRAAWRLDPPDGVDYVLARLTATETQHFLGGGERRSAVDRRGRVDRLKVWSGCASNAPAPWYLSSGGYGVLVDTESVGSVAFPGAVDDARFSCQWGTTPCPVESRVRALQLCERGNELAYWIFTGGFEELQRHATAVLGRPAVPPASLFELIHWRDEVTGGAQLLDDVQQVLSRGIPLGWALLDNPWESCVGSLTFDPTTFPDPAGLVRDLAAQGVRLMAWVSPVVDPRCGAGDGYTGLVGGDGDLEAIDLTNAANRRELQRRLQALFATGVAAVKGDRGDEVDLEHASLAAGWGQTLHNTYPVLFEETVGAAARAAGLAPLPSIFRAGWRGSAPTVTGFWAGDQTGDVHGLRAAIRSAATAGLGGYSTWGSDIGGYHSSKLTANVFVRWAQLGAVSPVFEVGGDGPQATFWRFGATTVARFRAAALLHYELFPYLYELAQGAHATGVPVIRPLAFGYPADAQAWKHDLELLVGRDLLAAPVDSEAPSLRFPVHLPKGAWVDLFTGSGHRGGRTIRRPTTLDDFPLFLRAGAAIPFNLRADAVWPDPWQTGELNRDGRAGWLYAPSGRTAAKDFTAAATRRTITLRAGRAAREVQVLVLGRGAPRSVSIDGHRVSARSDLRAAATGWRLETGSFPGVLLKLRGGSRVTIVR